MPVQSKNMAVNMNTMNVRTYTWAKSSSDPCTCSCMKIWKQPLQLMLFSLSVAGFRPLVLKACLRQTLFESNLV